MVTNSSGNWAGRSLTSVMLPLRQTRHSSMKYTVDSKIENMYWQSLSAVFRFTLPVLRPSERGVEVTECCHMSTVIMLQKLQY